MSEHSGVEASIFTYLCCYVSDGYPAGVCGWDPGAYYGLSTTWAAGGSGWGTYFYFGGSWFLNDSPDEA